MIVKIQSFQFSTFTGQNLGQRLKKDIQAYCEYRLKSGTFMNSEKLFISFIDLSEMRHDSRLAQDHKHKCQIHP